MVLRRDAHVCLIARYIFCLVQAIQAAAKRQKFTGDLDGLWEDSLENFQFPARILASSLRGTCGGRRGSSLARTFRTSNSGGSNDLKRLVVSMDIQQPLKVNVQTVQQRPTGAKQDPNSNQCVVL